MAYIEETCVVEVGGTEYMAQGAVVTPDYCMAYLGDDHVLTDWHGAQLGTYRITASWPTPGSYVSDKMHQVEATIDGIVYTGRSAGTGMLYRGRRKARQPRS